MFKTVVDNSPLIKVSTGKFAATYALDRDVAEKYSIRRYGFCHPAAKRTRQRIAFYSGVPLVLGPEPPPPQRPPLLCLRCGGEMIPLARLLSSWKLGRAPPGEADVHLATHFAHDLPFS